MISMAHTACRDMDNDTGADPVEGGIAVVRSTWPTLSLGQAGLICRHRRCGLVPIERQEEVGSQRNGGSAGGGSAISASSRRSTHRV
jgi:hypothetical protein